MNKIKLIYHLLTPIFMGCLLCSCIDPFDTEFVDFESTLVVDATITDELKRQEVSLTKTFRFQEDVPSTETGAKVTITNNDGAEFLFEETDTGSYLSNMVFAAEPGKSYQLNIATKDGKEYSSESMRLPSVNKIDSLYAKRITNDMDEDGIAIFVDTSNPTDDSNFYRYEYEETYKVIAPRWNARELEVVDESDGTVTIIIVPRSLDERVCYPSRSSSRIILVDTDNLEGGRVSNFMVHFVNRNNYIISHRYSILVRQYVQSRETSDFLETLNEFSSSESLFSETQPGFLEGNIFSEEGSNEKILGYFDISAVDEKRIFFDYEDFFPGERLPPYVAPCPESAPAIGLIDLIRWDLVKFIKTNDGEFQPGGPYITVPQVCGDCTILGTSEVPDFWIE